MFSVSSLTIIGLSERWRAGVTILGSIWNAVKVLGFLMPGCSALITRVRIHGGKGVTHARRRKPTRKALCNFAMEAPQEPVECKKARMEFKTS